MNPIGLAEDAACRVQSFNHSPAATEGGQYQRLKIPSNVAGGRDIHIEAPPSLKNPSHASSEEIAEKCPCDDFRGSNSSVLENGGDVCWSEDVENSYKKAARAFPSPGEMTGPGTDASEVVTGVKDGRRTLAIDFLFQESQKSSPKYRKEIDLAENHAQGGGTLFSPLNQDLNRIREESFKTGVQEKSPDKIQKVNSAVPRKRKARGKASRHVPSQLPGMTTRAHPRSRIFCITDLPEDIGPMRRWPCSVRPERPEYPACMDGVEEEFPGAEDAAADEEDTSSTSDLSSEASGEGIAEASGSFLGLESCIVPGALEAVIVFCRTSPLLPGQLRPEPGHLRTLLYDSCLLQCVLRGVAPDAMAAYLDSVSFRKSAADFRDLSDAAIFVGE